MGMPTFRNWTIRKKLLVSMLVLGVVIAVLGYSSFSGAYAYRDLATTLSVRAAEIPITAELTRVIDELRTEFPSLDIREPLEFRLDSVLEEQRQNERFQFKLNHVRDILSKYKLRLTTADIDDKFLSDRSDELEQVATIEFLIDRIEKHHEHFKRDHADFRTLQQLHDLELLSNVAHSLPMMLAKRMSSFREEVRARYRTWIGLTWSSALLAGGLLIGLISYARIAVIRPFKELLAAARKVASGDFTIRINNDSKDELAELANAINMGVASFLEIEKDLNEQVRERSREVIRNEQLASVGFLAAGVAHEINNPLASIAWSAEALESRVHRILRGFEEQNDSQGPSGVSPESSAGSDVETLKVYLRRIQDEAFRCKGITERLLDFSRLGNDERKQYVDLSEIIEDVVDMVRHLGQFRAKRIVFDPGTTAMMAWASPQEMKQVVLNLLTNALESIDSEKTDGCVRVMIDQSSDQVSFVVEDNGCGMTEEVQQHLFEPFFTRRRDGRGTGLGLPITSRIIADHGGHIVVKNLGIGVGSRFEVCIPNHPPSESRMDRNDSERTDPNIVPHSLGKRYAA